MRYIGEVERSGKHGKPHYSSFSPCESATREDKTIPPPQPKLVKSTINSDQSKPKDVLVEGSREGEELLSEYLPCHYFGTYNRTPRYMWLLSTR
jgi:hypothetical protein